MDYKYIEQLVERYFEAETTLQEEQILRSFFAQTDSELPESLAAYAPLFAALSDKATLGEEFDNRIMAAIGIEATPADVPVRAHTIRLGERLRPLFKAAAVVAIVLTIGNAVNQSLKAVDIWEEPLLPADVVEASGDGLALEGVTIDSATLYGQVMMTDTVAPADTTYIQY